MNYTKRISNKAGSCLIVFLMLTLFIPVCIIMGLYFSSYKHHGNDKATQAAIVEEAKNVILENENNESTTFMFSSDEGYRLNNSTQKQIVNYAGEHGMVVTQVNDHNVVFRKANLGTVKE